jgi:hypothetical protein
MMLSNFGMGSVMYNYYRKTNDEDEDLPKVSCTYFSDIAPLLITRNCSKTSDK